MGTFALGGELDPFAILSRASALASPAPRLLCAALRGDPLSPAHALLLSSLCACAPLWSFPLFVSMCACRYVVASTVEARIRQLLKHRHARGAAAAAAAGGRGSPKRRDAHAGALAAHHGDDDGDVSGEDAHGGDESGVDGASSGDDDDEGESGAAAAAAPRAGKQSERGSLSMEQLQALLAE